jgi:putative iron-regulated protein
MVNMTSDLLRTRRPLSAAAFLLTAVLSMAACSTDSETPVTESTNSESSIAIPETTAAEVVESSIATEPVATEPVATETTVASAAGTVNRSAVVTGYAELVEASYAASIASSEALLVSITTLLTTPTDETMAAAKKQWLVARDDYGPTEAFRLYDGPIDAPETGPEGRINAWPMDEAYVDYVVDAPDAGIINNVAAFPEITQAVLVEANEKGGETNISTGWHAIEFLLWGQDANADGPGNRPITDYTTSPVKDRRAKYLSLLATQLVADLRSVHAQWTPAGAYRTAFIADPDASLAKILRGIGALSAGEVAGERMAVPFETKDQEDEHSCFSDNTNADVRNNTIGIRGVYIGELAGMNVASLSSLIAAINPELDARLRTELDTSVELASTFPVPFERMIAGVDDSPGRLAMLKSIESLEKQGDTIAEVAKALNLSVSLEV